MWYFPMERSGLLLPMLPIVGIPEMFWTNFTKTCTHAWKTHGANDSNLWWEAISTHSWIQDSAALFSRMWLQPLTSLLPTMMTIISATWTPGHSKVLAASADALISSCVARRCVFTSAHATCNLDLGSDHRAVTVSLDLGFRRRKDRKCFRCVKRWKPPLDPQGVPHTYHAILQEELGVKKPTTLNGLEDVLQQSVHRINTTSKLPKPKPVWQDAVLQDLLQRRRAAHDRSERANLSKLIRKHLRRNMRRRNARVSQILAEFQDLGRLDSAHNAPIRRVAMANPGPTPEMFRGFLGNIFMSDTGHDTATLAGLDDANCLDLVPPFTLQELGTVLRDLHYGRAADADGMVAEMFKYSNIPLQECLLNIYNSMLASGSFETSWQHTLFTMLPKPGDSSQPNNWRPIAVLKITYKFFPDCFTTDCGWWWMISSHTIRPVSAPILV